jgi:hypothetical protein
MLKFTSYPQKNVDKYVLFFNENFVGCFSA